MRKTIFLGAAALIAIIGTDPAFCLQAATPAGEATQPNPADPSTPPVPPVDDPSQPAPPVTEPLPPEMPPVAGEGQTNPPMPPASPSAPVINRDVPFDPMATPPSAGTDGAVSGGTTQSMMTPQPATKTYPLCTRDLQDNCRNPGEGPQTKRKPKR